MPSSYLSSAKWSSLSPVPGMWQCSKLETIRVHQWGGRVMKAHANTHPMPIVAVLSATNFARSK